MRTSQTSQDNKRQNEEQISHADMDEDTGGKDLAVSSTGFWVFG